MIAPTEQPAAPAAPAPAAKPSGQDAPPIVRIVLAAAKVIYQEAMSKHIIGVLSASENKKLGVHNATLMVLNMLKEKGMPAQVMDRVAPMVASLVIELGVAAGVLSEEEFPKRQGAQAPAGGAAPEEEKKPGGGLVAAGMGA